MNTSVQATGMKVTAAAGTGLVISAYDADLDSNSKVKGWTVPAGTVDLSSLNTSRTTKTIEPASTVDVTNWYTATAASESSSTSKNNEYTKYTVPSSKYASQVFYYDQIKIQTNDGAAIDGKSLVLTTLNATTSTAQGYVDKSADLNMAIRVALVVTIGTTSTTYFYAPNYDSAYPNVKGVQVTGGTGYSAVDMDDVTDIKLYYGGQTITLSEGSIAGETTIEVYIFYDGEDENCFTNNTLNGLDELTVDMTFVAQ